MNLRESLAHIPSELWISVFTKDLNEICTWPNWKMLQEKNSFFFCEMFYFSKYVLRVTRYIVLECIV